MITVDKLDVVYGTKENRNHVVRDISFRVNKGCLLYTSPSPRD